MATGLTNGSRNSCRENVPIFQMGTDLMNKERADIIKLFRSDHGVTMIECRECFGEPECSLFHF